MSTLGDDVEILTPPQHWRLVTTRILRVLYPLQGGYTLLLFARNERSLTSEIGQQETITLPSIPVGPPLERKTTTGA